MKQLDPQSHVAAAAGNLRNADDDAAQPHSVVSARRAGRRVNGSPGTQPDHSRGVGRLTSGASSARGAGADQERASHPLGAAATSFEVSLERAIENLPSAHVAQDAESTAAQAPAMQSMRAARPVAASVD